MSACVRTQRRAHSSCGVPTSFFKIEGGEVDLLALLSQLTCIGQSLTGLQNPAKSPWRCPASNSRPRADPTSTIAPPPSPLPPSPHSVAPLGAL